MLLDDLFLDDITESFAITLTCPLNCAWSALNVFEHNSYHIKKLGVFHCNFVTFCSAVNMSVGSTSCQYGPMSIFVSLIVFPDADMVVLPQYIFYLLK